MANHRFDVKVDMKKLERAISEVKKAAEQAMNDCVDDLVRVSSEIAPHDHGVLEKSWSRNVRTKGDIVEGTVEYSVKESSSIGGQFNYATWTHEDPNYEYGPGTLAKPGTQGMSGTHYEPGRKYLTRPLEGEAEAYRDHIEAEIRKVLGG